MAFDFSAQLPANREIYSPAFYFPAIHRSIFQAVARNGCDLEARQASRSCSPRKNRVSPCQTAHPSFRDEDAPQFPRGFFVITPICLPATIFQHDRKVSSFGLKNHAEHNPDHPSPCHPPFSHFSHFHKDPSR
jgi:hypothetical protein